MSKEKAETLELIAKDCLVAGGEVIRRGDLFLAADAAEFKRYLDRGEATRPGDPAAPRCTSAPSRIETPESRKGSKLETRTPFDG